jgi:hypothetical protein
VSFLAAERAAQILAPTVTWIADEGNPAMMAAGQVLPKARVVFENNLQCERVIQDKSAYRIFSVPIWTELEMIPDFYYK